MIVMELNQYLATLYSAYAENNAKKALKLLKQLSTGVTFWVSEYSPSNAIVSRVIGMHAILSGINSAKSEAYTFEYQNLGATFNFIIESGEIDSAYLTVKLDGPGSLKKAIENVNSVYYLLAMIASQQTYVAESNELALQKLGVSASEAEIVVMEILAVLSSKSNSFELDDVTPSCLKQQVSEVKSEAVIVELSTIGPFRQLKALFAELAN